MKKSLVDYASSLSSDSLDIFEELIKEKYFKFIAFFNILQDYSDYITKMDYEFTDKTTLIAKIGMTKDVKLDEKKELIETWRSIGYDVEAKITGKKMKIMIIYEE